MRISCFTQAQAIWKPAFKKSFPFWATKNVLHCVCFSLRTPQGGLAQSVGSLGASLSGLRLVLPAFIHCLIHSITLHLVNARHLLEPLPRVREDTLRKDVWADSSVRDGLTGDTVTSSLGEGSLALTWRPAACRAEAVRYSRSQGKVSDRPHFNTCSLSWVTLLFPRMSWGEGGAVYRSWLPSRNFSKVFLTSTGTSDPIAFLDIIASTAEERAGLTSQSSFRQEN